MFDKKVENLFVQKAIRMALETKSANGAKKYSTSGNDFVDNFAAIATFLEPRSYSDIDADMRLLWSIDPKMCLKLAVYIRTITRKPKVVTKNDTKVLDTQRGQGLKHEGIMRMIWIAKNHPKTFKANIDYFIAAGSWKDIFKMLSIDLQYNGWKYRKLNWNLFYNVIEAGLLNKETTHLVRKYMPTIRTNKKCTTIESQANTLIGRWLARKLFDNIDKDKAFKEYRRLKSEGIAHNWQQKISQQLYDTINFDTIAGRALSAIVGSSFLTKHNLVGKYRKWIESKKEVKYTGFVFDLFNNLNSNTESYVIDTINAQFAKLVDSNKSSNLLVVRDTSASMQSTAIGCNTTSFDIAKAMALYFSEFLSGPFANCYAEFNDTCILRKWKGNTPCDKWLNDNSYANCDTNFQSVIDLFINLKNQGIEESYFPSGIVCISDCELDDCGNDSNFQTAIKRLKDAEFSKGYVDNFKIILWDIPNYFYGHHEVKFEDFADAPNLFYISGYDPSAIDFILGNSEFKASPRNAKELFEAAMNQTILNELKVVN